MIADCCLCHLMLFADIICREQNYNKMLKRNDEKFKEPNYTFN